MGILTSIKQAVSHAWAGEGLRAKVMRGGTWLAGGSFAEQTTRFARNMLLTRLLAPSSFGTMALVMSSASVLQTITDVGVNAAVVQNPRGSEPAYLNAAWWLAMGRAWLIYAIILVSSPAIARFYGHMELSVLLRVALAGALFDAGLSPRSILLQKQMNFKRWAKISNGGAICGVIVTVILSFILRDVWALVIGFCSENAFRCLLSYIFCPGLPSLRIDWGATRELLKFSRGVAGLSFLNLIFTRTDIFVLAKLYPAASLGLYTMAVYLVQTPGGFLISVLSQAAFPAFSHVQSDSERLNRMLIEMTSWLILLGLPLLAFLWLCAPSLLTLAYGSRYAATAGALAVAALVAFPNTLNSLITCVFYAQGQPGLHRRAVAASAITMMICIYPACKLFGLVGGQLSALVAISISYLLQIERIRKITKLDLRRYGWTCGPAALVSLAVLGAGIGLRHLGFATRPVTEIAVSGGACLIAYALCVPAFSRIRTTSSSVSLEDTKVEDSEIVV